MRKNKSQWALLIGALTICGCSSHLVFVEDETIGLKAKFEANNPAPAQFTLGYRRGVVAVIPQQDVGNRQGTNAVSVTTTNTGSNTVVTVIADPTELMSLYTVFRANVGFTDPVEIRHFLATGSAASSLVANDGDLRKITDSLKGGR
ncbi:MAG TPA: hypothetical protein VL486_13965 [Verrucomicrobiae bacterium]|nr:hypothetical protein [Verrucomicrobiae bacterium]